MINNKPSLLQYGQRQYSINLQFGWSGSFGTFDIPGLTADGRNFRDVFDLHSISGNVVLPPVRSMVGTINFLNVASTPGVVPGPVVIYIPDTGETISLPFNTSRAGTDAVSLAWVGGIASEGWLSFAIPIRSSGQQFQFFKRANPGGSACTGLASITLLTEDITPFICAGL